MQLKIKGIMSYPHLFTPRSVQPGDDPKYSVTILLRKDDPQVAQIQAIIAQEKANAWPTGFPPNGKVFLRDCTETQPGNAAVANWVEVRCGAPADNKPAVVDANIQPVMDPGAVVAGEIAWVSLNTFTYNMAVSKGVGAGLNGVMLTKELGEFGCLDNRPTAEQMFADVAGGHAPAPAAAPSTPPPPAPNFMTPPPPPAVPQFTMTAAANGVTREAYHAAGWTDDMLIANGLLIKQ